MVMRMREAIKASRGILLLKRDEGEPTVNYVVVANLDRFGRDVKNMMSLKNQLQVHHVEIVAVGQMMKTGTPMGEMMYCQKAMEAEMFSRDRSIRITSVKMAKRSLGHYLGGLPAFGYKVQKINGIRKIVLDIEEQKIISMIRQLKRSLSDSQIALTLNNRKLTKRGQVWNVQRIRSVNLKNVTISLTPELPPVPHNTPQPTIEMETSSTSSDDMDIDTTMDIRDTDAHLRDADTDLRDADTDLLAPDDLISS
jgi:DNA invertase Pin-like site-specific DNA recombinase